ncbi:MAG: zinc ribbon domain-containing protein [Desulfobacter sp.]|nr:zinc ribbon domain-containing protein [Desulfobacter sp.]WDP87384.1 MAG: zinc ribbon domain-containing protein [Desulfobacter sp.]
MPLYDFQCLDCSKTCEILLVSQKDSPVCTHCGSSNLKKLMAAHSSMSGTSRSKFPGPNDTTCCGSAPGEKSGCAGPGSCCGKTF